MSCNGNAGLGRRKVKAGSSNWVDSYKGRNHLGPWTKRFRLHVEETAGAGVGLDDNAEERHIARLSGQAACDFPLQEHGETAGRFGGCDEAHDQTRSHAVGQVGHDVKRASGQLVQVKPPGVAGHDLDMVAIAKAVAQACHEHVLNLHSGHTQTVREQRLGQVTGPRADLDDGGAGRKGGGGCNAPLHGPIHKEVLAAPAGRAKRRPRGGAHSPSIPPVTDYRARILPFGSVSEPAGSPLPRLAKGGQIAAVRIQGCTGYVGGARRQKEGDATRNLGGGGVAPEGNGGLALLKQLRISTDVRSHTRSREAWADTVDPDLVRRQFLGDGAGYGPEGSLGGAVVGLARFGRFGTDGADLDDRPRFTPANHVLGDGLGQKDRATHVDGKHVIPDVCIDFFQRLPPGVAGHVGQCVHAAVSGDRVGNEGLASGDIGYVKLAGFNRVTEARLLDPVGQSVTIDIRRDYLVTVGRQAFHAGTADAVGGPGHDSYRWHQCVISPPST